MELGAELVKQLGVPGALAVTFMFCAFLTIRSSSTRSDAESEAIKTNATMASTSQAEAFRAKDLLLAATERLGHLEVRVSQLEEEGKQKDITIAELRAELSEVQQTVTILQERLQSERKEKETMALEKEELAREKEALAREKALMHDEITSLVKQIELLRTRMDKLDDEELTALAQEVERLKANAPVTTLIEHKETT